MVDQRGPGIALLQPAGGAEGVVLIRVPAFTRVQFTA